jgi:REP element-mobilizing transposase RayT
MPVNKPHTKEAGIYFVTFTNHNWIPLFQIANGYDLVYKWFEHLKTKGHYVSGYVIMPNHLHVLLVFNNPAQSINTIIGNGKRFLAYGIIKRLTEQNREDILSQLSEAVQPMDRKRGKFHEVFQPSFDIKRCDTFKFIYQKLDYIHNNPVAKKWNLVTNRFDYEHSSARFYDTGNHASYAIAHIDAFMDQWIERSTTSP